MGVRLKGGGMRSVFRVPRFGSERLLVQTLLFALPLLTFNLFGLINKWEGDIWLAVALPLGCAFSMASIVEGGSPLWGLLVANH